MIEINLFSNAKTVLDVALPFLTTFCAINLGLVAFVYPKIFETTRSLKDISQIFIDKLQRKKYLHYYLGFITSCLIINMASLLLCVVDSDFISLWLLSVNFVITLASVLVSYLVFKLLNKYYNYTERIFRLEKIKLSSKEKNEDLELLQILSIHSIKNQYDLSSFRKYLSLIDKIFRKNILNNMSKLRQSNFLGHGQENDFLFRPLEMLTYIYQYAIEISRQEISNNIFFVLRGIVQDALLKWEHTPALEQTVVNSFVSNLKYKIKRGKIYSDDLIFLSDFYFILLEYYEEKLPEVNGDINSSLWKPNNIVLPIFQTMIDFDVSSDLLKFWQDLMQNIIHSDKIDRIQILRLNTQIISYMIFKEKYKNAYEFMYYETPKNNMSERTFPQMPSYLSEIFLCYIGKDSTFSQNQTFDKNQNSEEFKYFSLFLFLCNAKDRYDNLKKQEVKDWRKVFLDENIQRYSEVPSQMIKSLSNEELFYNYFNNKKNIKSKLNDFFSITALMNQFELNNSYKKFINKKIMSFRDKIIKRRSSILNKKLSTKVRTQIESYSKDIFDSLVPDCFIQKIFETRRTKPKGFISRLRNISLFRPKDEAIITPLGNISIKQEKGRLLVYDRLARRVFNLLSDEMHKKLFKKLSSISHTIDNYRELEDKELLDHCIVTNFGAGIALLSKFIPKENICLDKSEFHAKAIKINNTSIPIIIRDHLFHENFCKEPTILLLPRNKIKLIRGEQKALVVRETKLEGGKVFDDLFNSDYSTNKEIEITIPSILDIQHPKEMLAFKLIRKEESTPNGKNSNI